MPKLIRVPFSTIGSDLDEEPSAAIVLASDEKEARDLCLRKFGHGACGKFHAVEVILPKYPGYPRVVGLEGRGSDTWR